MSEFAEIYGIRCYKDGKPVEGCSWIRDNAGMPVVSNRYKLQIILDVGGFFGDADEFRIESFYPHWTNEIPATPGYYWLRFPDDPKDTGDVVQVEYAGEDLVFQHIGFSTNRYKSDIPDNAEWQGPITPEGL